MVVYATGATERVLSSLGEEQRRIGEALGLQIFSEEV